MPESGTPEFVIELVEQLRNMILHLVSRRLEERLETEMDRFLGRKRYVRRHRSPRKETRLYCSQCRSHQRQDFRRNGHYPQQLAVQWGRVRVQVPQAKCQCGGNVHLKYQTLPPGQRIWEDLRLEIQAEYGRGLSYRQIKVDLDQRLSSSVGLRTLNQQVLALGSEKEGFVWLERGEIPSVVRLDGIWITVMLARGNPHLLPLSNGRGFRQFKARLRLGCFQCRHKTYGFCPSDGSKSFIGVGDHAPGPLEVGR